ncbi:FAD binding domain-containing protein [Scleroderma citrinum]
MPSQTLGSYVDVLVIGAGPAGMMCSNALASAGDIKVRVVDQRPLKVAAGQADGIQPRTIEVLQSYGLAERLLREGNHMYMCLTGRAPDVTAPTARYPFEVTLHQGAIEQIFIDSMNLHGLRVDRPVKPCAIELVDNHEQLNSRTSYPVKVKLEHLDAATDEEKTEVVYAKYVIGADGAHSWVRKSFGITMDGEHTDYIWGVVDMLPDTNIPDVRNKTAIHSTNGSCMIIPREDDKIRLYVQLSDQDVVDPGTGRVVKSRMNPEGILEAARKTFHPFRILPLTDIEWWTLYIIGQRVASTYSVGDRVFIAGDACHTHSPKAGQGMNASMNDTHNLAWKIAQVLRGWAHPSILKTYESERRKYAQDLIDFDKQFAALFSGKPRTSENQDGISHEQFLQAFQTFGGFTSGIGVHYGHSAIVNTKYQTCARNLAIGQRMVPQIFIRAADARPVEIQDLLPADIRYKILVFLGTLDESQLLRVDTLAKELNEPTSFLRKYPVDGQTSLMFDIITIVAGNKDNFNYLNVPEIFRPHWSKVLLDDTDVTGTKGGGAYERFGINTKDVTFVVVRPDGYVGMIAPFSALDDVQEYFASFLIPHTPDTRNGCLEMVA